MHDWIERTTMRHRCKNAAILNLEHLETRNMPAAPVLLSILRADPAAALTDAASVAFTVTYNQAVTGVDASDFRVARPVGVPGNPTIAVLGSGATYTVTISGISVDGQMRLGQLDDDSIVSTADGLPLYGPGKSGGFANFVTFAAGTGLSDVAFADLNGDFKPDLVIAHPATSRVSVLLGNGDGTFRPAITAAVNTPKYLHLADVNGDQKIDVVTISNNKLNLLLGNGDGTFRPAVSAPTADEPATIANINGDGVPDLLFAQSVPTRAMRLMLGNGDGTFRSATTAVSPISSTSTLGFVKGADVNGDGKADLVYSPSSGAFAVALGNGDGTFAPAAVTAGSNPANAALEDVNGDGILDVITATGGLTAENGSIGVALGNGDGTFKPRVTFACAPLPNAVVVADINGDGFADVVVHTATSAFSILLGNGNGTFRPFTAVTSNAASSAGLALADVNGDGQPDLATADKYVGVSLFLNNRFAFLSDDYQIDQTAPLLALTSKPPSASNSASATIAFTASDSSLFGVASGLSSVEYQLDGAVFAPAISPIGLSGLSVGPHSFILRAIDGLGHISTISYSWVVDLTAPIATITSQPPSLSTSATATFGFTGTDPVTGGFASGLSRLEARLDGTPFATAPGTKTYTGLSEGLHTFNVRAVDNAGSVSTVSYSWTVQTKAPPVLTFSEFADPHPAPANQFGAVVVPLSTGNIVVTSPGDDAGGPDSGAVYLFNGITGALISALNGSHPNDRIGDGSRSVLALSNGNFVVASPLWDNGAIVDAGAVTFGNGTTGISGTVSAANSLIGSSANDSLGLRGSLEGITAQRTGTSVPSGGGLFALPNGNYVIVSPQWDNGSAVDAGAATLGSGTSGVVGTISNANSLVGTSANDTIGSYGILILPNSNYVIVSPNWDNGPASDAGAISFLNGSTGTAGVIDSSNSLVGSQSGDHIGDFGVMRLTNGNYVVMSPSWHNGTAVEAGAATFGNAVSGVTGVVSAANSLVGSQTNDRVSREGVLALATGNYVVTSTNWANGTKLSAGAITFGNATTGVSGAVSESNSLVGSQQLDLLGPVIPLTNGNYVCANGNWNGVGAATFGNGVTGISGAISAANSLIGAKYCAVTPLANGNYLVQTAGAVTFGNGVTGVVGSITTANSLIGEQAGYYGTFGAGYYSNLITTLSNGNYVVRSPAWDNGTIQDAGAVTFGNGVAGTAGFISAANSLIGTSANDRVGLGGVTELTNGNYVVASPYWSNGAATAAGAVTFGNGATGITGIVSAANSLVGTSTNDNVGAGGPSFVNYPNLLALRHGNYVVRSPNWNNGAATVAGAVTFGDAEVGATGPVSSANSIVGTTANDGVGYVVSALANGNYVGVSQTWDNGSAANAGAASFGSGTSGASGPINGANSLIGATANDAIGTANFGYFPYVFSNGNYLVLSPYWDNGPLADAGAASFGNGVSGLSGIVSTDNSAVGTTANAGLQATVAVDNVNNTFYISFVNDGNGRVIVGSQTDGFKYTTSASLSANPQATTGGQLVTLSATVGPNPRNLGTVTFRDGGAVLAANVPLVGGVAVFQTAMLSQGLHSILADFSGGGGFSVSTSNTISFVVSAPVAPHVASVVVNGATPGLTGLQRSRLAGLVITFDERVQLDTNAMTLTLHTNNVSFGGVLQPVGIGVLPSSLNLATTDNITWLVTFTGNTEDGADSIHSLKDGVYDFKIDASLVHPFGAPSTNMASNSITTFHRLFGDTGPPTTPGGGMPNVDFEAVVNSGDNLAFRSAFNKPSSAAEYKAYLDFDGSGIINTGDNLQFRSRFNKTLTWRV